MSQGHNHLNHATWECKYHTVFAPTYRKKVLFGQIKRQLGTVFHELARRKECKIEEGHLMPDHVHLILTPSDGGPQRAALGEAHRRSTWHVTSREGWRGCSGTSFDCAG